MQEPQQSNERPRQFTLRTILLVMVFIALGFCWYASHQAATRTIQDLRAQLQYAETALENGQDRSDFRQLMDKWKNTSSKGILSHAELKAANLRGVSIDADASAFQGTIFSNCDLEGASLAGGLRSFQASRFDDSKLVDAELTGGGAAFQMSSFVNCDLTGATLTGGGASFQVSTFKDAKLIGARVICSGASFQLVNIDGAEFQGADLSALDPDSLASCYFKKPPIYDGKTRFPTDFDPVAQRWMRAAE